MMIGLRNKKERSRQNECNKVYSETIFHVIFQLTKGTERLQKKTLKLPIAKNGSGHGSNLECREN